MIPRDMLWLFMLWSCFRNLSVLIEVMTIWWRKFLGCYFKSRVFKIRFWDDVIVFVILNRIFLNYWIRDRRYSRNFKYRLSLRICQYLLSNCFKSTPRALFLISWIMPIIWAHLLPLMFDFGRLCRHICYQCIFSFEIHTWPWHSHVELLLILIPIAGYTLATLRKILCLQGIAGHKQRLFLRNL